jgi:acetyltransferase-like isoleucine patch superfamily enzyme
MKLVSWLFLCCYRGFIRLSCKCFSLAISGAFAGFGKRTVLMHPVRLFGENRIKIGAHVFLGSGCCLMALDDGDNRSIAISIGSGTSIAGTCVISALRHVCLEENVLLARNVYIADHTHKYSQRDQPILAQGVEKVKPVVIKRGAWLGQNVVVCPGVTIGAGSVIGANSVVNQDIPDFSVAVGSPARIVKNIGALL